MKKVYIETYGCQMNVADTEIIMGLLRKEGFERTDDASSADLMLVNTCAIRDNAEQRVIGRLGELKRHKNGQNLLGVVGCMAQRLGASLLDRCPHVDLIAGPDGYRSLGQLILRAGEGDRVADTEFKAWEHYEDVTPMRSGGASAFVTVQRGCDHKCTFCIVPMTRGPERSRRLDDVINEIGGLAGRGVSEVTLLGQTVNSYHDGKSDFADLLRAAGAVPGIRRVRFTSPHPNDFTDRVIEAMAETPEVCEHVHLPAQSGSSRVLKRMLRRYNKETFVECVRRLRDAVGGIALTTDIIVGFPGETEADFLETMSLVREVEFDDAFTFRYSVRDGTPAQKLGDVVSKEVSGERLSRLIEEVRSIARVKNAAMVGETREVLVEKVARRGELLQSRTRNNKVVLLEGTEEDIGGYQTVRITGTTGSTLIGIPARSVRNELAVVT
ncbi:MAG: tRNA (N6-isopentenyl adenosine(37)-C2)-methylthiotransferase MiaB [Gemmatimonadetes bacterium]|nr:tRNA (N6-isopentenyl adenosine(37)-C2)-methylthiotransferase MiaB [Gemmatimonadota bacterium]